MNCVHKTVFDRKENDKQRGLAQQCHITSGKKPAELTKGQGRKRAI